MATDDDSFRRAPIARYPLGDSTELVYLPLLKTARLLGQSDLTVASSCASFRSLAEHAAHLARSRGSDEPAALTQLRSLAEQGLLVSGEDLFARALEGDAESVTPEITCLAVPTADRPNDLQRAIRSYAGNFRRYGRNPRILVADDSSCPDSSELSLRAAKCVGADLGLTLHYVGREHRRELIEELAASGEIPRHVIEFGLNPDTNLPRMGANRNLIQLYSLGALTLSVDDDTLCRPCLAPDDSLSGCLRFGTRFDPTEFWFHADRESALAAASDSDIDVLSGHEVFLGASVRRALSNAGQSTQVDLHSACDHLLSSIWTGKGRISVTTNGTIGDSGMFTGRLLPRHSGPTHDRLTASETAYRTALRSREVIRQSPCATICHHASFATMFTGFDHRGLLPPFLPVCRNEDGVFARTLEYCAPDSYFGYLPWSLVHDPAGTREYSGMTPAEVRFSDIIIALIGSRGAPTAHQAVDAVIQSVGAVLIDAASMAADDFCEVLRSHGWSRASQMIRYNEAILNKYGYCPPYWAADLESDILCLREAVSRPEFGLPVDLGAIDPDRALEETQRLVRLYGELLQWWPAIVERTRELMSEDRVPMIHVEE